MRNKDSLVLAAALALSLGAAHSFAAEPAKPTLDSVVVPPKPAAAAAAAPTKGATQPVVNAAAPAPVTASQPAAAEFKLPAPQISLPTTAPVIAVEKPAAKPAMAETKTAPADAKPAVQTKTASATVKPTDPAVASKPKAEAKAKSAPSGKEETKQAKQKKKQDEKKVVEVSAVPGELVQRTTPKFFFGMFDAPKPKLAPLSEEQVEHDVKIASVPEKKKFKVKEEFMPVTVPFKGYKPGTIVIDTDKKYLYFVESPISAIRYAVAVGKEGLLFTGKATVGAKQPWPRWIPTKDMIARDPKKYGKYADGMDGGPGNPLGARAIYLYQGKQDTYLRIHGTTQPETIGTASSNGCFRMINEHVIDLYKRVEQGAEVVVL